MEQRKIQENKFFCQSRKPPNNAKCAASLLSGCAGGSDRRQRKATPKGVFGRTRRRTAWGLGKPQQASRKSEKDIPAHCLPTLSEISDKTGQQCFRNILLDIPKTLVGVPPKPQAVRLRVRPNTPDGVAFPLPSVAHSCTSAQEKRGAAASRQECAGPGTISPWEISRVIGSITMISRPTF